jgi:FSR family fosmidomycin resistance protein-like MFS transporter
LSHEDEILEAPLHEKPLQAKARTAAGTVLPILFAISLSHLLNDTLQSLIPALYPMVKQSFLLSFAQVGLITFTYQMTASLFQPLVGLLADRKPQPYSLAVGMGFTLVGLALLSFAGSFVALLVSVALVGVGSSIFHPESSRVAHMAGGERRGFAQSVFQVGGSVGSSLGPLLAALIIATRGRSQLLWFTPLALGAIIILYRVGRWYAKNTFRVRGRPAATAGGSALPIGRRRIAVTVAILLVLIFSKYFYLASLGSYYTFYLMDKFQLSIRSAQLHLFLFQFAVAAGTLIGGPVGDRVGRKYVIWFSILGAAPFSLLLPHANLLWTTILSLLIGVVIASAFSAILVYAQELIPGKLGLVSGLFFGFAFGMGAVGSAVLGRLADQTSIAHVYRLCSFLPLLGLIAGFLPNVEGWRSKLPAT